MTKPHRAVQAFAKEMEHKLALNTHKGGWDGLTFQYLMYRLEKEVRELWKVYDDPEEWIGGDPRHITEECADIANFAMMIADKYGAKTQ